MAKKLAVFASFPAVLALLIFLLLHGLISSGAAFEAMVLSAKVVVPCLFPFGVLAGILVRSRLALQWGAAFGRPVQAIYGVSPCCTAGILLGLLCGFPVGASVIAQLYRDGCIDKDSAERILPCCTNAGPAFILTIAGRGIFGSEKVGWLLLAIHLIASFLVGLTFRNPVHPSRVQSAPPPLRLSAAVLTDSVRDAALTMVQVSGFIVLFSVLLALLPKFWPLAALLELTNGLTAIRTASLPANILLPAVSAALGWSGLCVHSQVLSFTAPLGLSCQPYLLGKLFHGIYAALLAIPVSFLIPVEVPASTFFRTSDSVSTTVWTVLSCCLFFASLWKFRQVSAIMRKKLEGGR